jgi:hypothetical protein
MFTGTLISFICCHFIRSPTWKEAYMKVRQRNTIWLKHERERFYLSKKKLGEINTKKMKKVKIICPLSKAQ